MNSQTQHTPGPWKFNQPYIVKANSDPNGSCGDSVIAITSNTVSHVRFAADVASFEDAANVRLISAAPELLAACEALWTAQSRLAGNLPTWFNFAADQARAAIAKAKGSQ
jgi:hypothetical protein